MPQPQAVIHSASPPLREMLSESQWQTVSRIAMARQGDEAIVAWSVGFLTIQQLDFILLGNLARSGS